MTLQKHLHRPIKGVASLLTRDHRTILVKLIDISEVSITVACEMNIPSGLVSQICASVFLMPPRPTLLKHDVEVGSCFLASDGNFHITLAFKNLDSALFSAIHHYVNAVKL